MPALERLESWLVPESIRGDWRSLFLVRSWGYCMLFALFFGSVAAKQGLGWLAAALGSMFLSSGACVLLLRTTARLRLLTNLSMAVSAPVLAFAGLLQNPANPLTPVFLVLLPLLAAFLLSRGEFWFWLGVSVVLGFSAEWLMASGYHLSGPERPHYQVVTALNLVAFLLLVAPFVRWFIGIRQELVLHLEAASRARTIFLANVSHEIRTPMNGVLGLTELVLSDALAPEQRARVELMQRSGQTLVRLIDDLLLVTRAESGSLVLSPAPTSISRLVADVLELFAPLAREKQLRLVSALDPAVPAWVQLDGVRWRQVLSILLSNAIKFTERGEVAVRVSVQGTRLVLQVQDDGPGIPPEVAARLFRPFEQADASTTRRYGGSGLGLALSRQLFEAMDGTVTVASTVGLGSVFTAELPLRVAEAEVKASAQRAVEAMGPRLPVLVVDDNAINLVVARGLVERAGYSVQLARNGREAVEAVARTRFALVLMDCQMPEMDGLEATRRIRAASVHRDTPIVALTASGLSEELDACRRAGMDDCLVKPVSLEMIQRALTLARNSGEAVEEQRLMTG